MQETLQPFPYTWLTPLQGILLLVLAAAAMYYIWLRRQYRNITSALPTLFGLPYIGVSYKLLNLKNVFRFIQDSFVRNNSDSVCLWVNSTPVIVTIDPEMIKSIIQSPSLMDKAHVLYAHFEKTITGSIIVSPAAKWKPNRKAFNRFVNQNNLLSFVPLFNDTAQMINLKLEKLVGHGEHDMYNVIKSVSLRLSIQTMMGVSLKTDDPSYNRLLDSFVFFIDYMFEYLIYTTLGIETLMASREFESVSLFLRDYLHRVIESRLNVESDTEILETQSESFVDAVMRCLRQGTLTNDEAVTECLTMILASFETSALAIYSTLFLLAMHPKIEERLFKELKAVFPDKDSPVLYTQLKDLPYLDMVIAETLRLTPPIPAIGRQAMCDTELMPGLMLPKGMQVIIPIVCLHRSERIWGSDACSFNPERFAPERIEQRNPYVYMPFSKGPRNCLGFRYAEITVRVVLINLLRNFKFSTTFQLKDLLLVPRTGLNFDVRPGLSIERRE